MIHISTHPCATVMDARLPMTGRSDAASKNTLFRPSVIGQSSRSLIRSSSPFPFSPLYQLPFPFTTPILPSHQPPSSLSNLHSLPHSQLPPSYPTLSAPSAAASHSRPCPNPSHPHARPPLPIPNVSRPHPSHLPKPSPPTFGPPSPHGGAIRPTGMRGSPRNVCCAGWRCTSRLNPLPSQRKVGSGGARPPRRRIPQLPRRRYP